MQRRVKGMGKRIGNWGQELGQELGSSGELRELARIGARIGGELGSGENWGHTLICDYVTVMINTIHINH